MAFKPVEQTAAVHGASDGLFLTMRFAETVVRHWRGLLGDVVFYTKKVM